MKLWASVLAVVLVVGFGCQPAKDGDKGAGSGSGEKVKLAFVTNNASDFWTIARKGTEKAAKEDPSIQVEFTHRESTASQLVRSLRQTRRTC
jgi:ribose transport system substrate-binding protein